MEMSTGRKQKIQSVNLITRKPREYALLKANQKLWEITEH